MQFVRMEWSDVPKRIVLPAASSTNFTSSSQASWGKTKRFINTSIIYTRIIAKIIVFIVIF